MLRRAVATYLRRLARRYAAEAAALPVSPCYRDCVNSPGPFCRTCLLFLTRRDRLEDASCKLDDAADVLVRGVRT